MNELQNKLLGELIGLVRVTDGNAHLVSPEATQILVDGLHTIAKAPEQIGQMLSAVDAQKRLMVPDCYLCANPCGKNAAYNMHLLDQEEPKLRKIKTAMLSAAADIAVALHSGISSDKAAQEYLYKALILIGMDGYTATELLPFLQEGTEILEDLKNGRI